MKKKPVIAILGNFPTWLRSDLVPPRNSSPSSWLLALHDAFSHSDEFEFHWIVLDQTIKEPIEYEDKGAIFHVIPAGNRKVSLFTAHFVNRFKIARYLKKLKPDLIHIWGTEFSYGLCGRDFKGKKLFSLQGVLTAIRKRSNLASAERLQSYYEGAIFRSMPIITAESLWAKERVLEICPKANVLLWEYAVQEHFFSILRNLDAKPCCLMGGTNTPVKNQQLAIRAFSRPELRHVTLYMAGEKPKGLDVLPDNIVTLGRINRNEMAELLSRVWAVVHPSFADTGPTMVKEARVVGVPVILSHECGAKDYVEHGKSGFVISPVDEQQLVDAVLYITHDKETSLVMGHHNQNLCRNALSRDTMVKWISNTYRSILNG